MFKRLFLPLLALAVAAVFFASCSKDDDFREITGVSFSNPPTVLSPGKTQRLQVNVFPGDVQAPYTLVFSSSNPQVATVDAQGNLRAVADGQTVIEVSVAQRPEISARFTLTVRTVPVERIVLSGTRENLLVGDFYTLTAKTEPADATETATLVFSSSTPQVATVDAQGKVTALAEGTSVITVTMREKPSVSASFTLTVKPVYKAPQNTRFRKVAYYPSYRNLTPAGIPDENLKMIDVACYSFATLNDNYTLSVQQPERLRAFAARCKALGVKVLICFGGGGSGSKGTYTKMTESPATRATFIRSLREIVETYDLDGVDNDWEYPRTTDGSDKGNTALMRELSAWLHDPAVGKMLTMAIASGQYEGAVASAIQDECFEYVDWFNVMCYDNYLGWAEKKPAPDPLEMFKIAYKYWVEKRHVPASKFVAGISAYGRPSDEQHNGTPMAYAEILRQGGDPDGFQASVSSSSYSGPIYYNGRPFVRQKARYCIDQGVGGIMFWEAGQDSQDEYSLIRAAYEEVGDYSLLP